MFGQANGRTGTKTTTELRCGLYGCWHRLPRDALKATLVAEILLGRRGQQVQLTNAIMDTSKGFHFIAQGLGNALITISFFDGQGTQQSNTFAVVVVRLARR